MRAALIYLLLNFAGFAQEMPDDHQNMPGMDMGTSASLPEDHAASGTSINPRSSPMDMIHESLGNWHFMFHGEAFIVDAQQTGPRGHDKLFSPNWFMGTAEHAAGGGTLEFSTMLSLEPATITNRSYPLLFQTGETAYGRPLVDAQHPHNFVMELSTKYTHPLTESTNLVLYFAPIGDPALGPVAYPHRESAMEFPQAPLSHHLQDSTHISYEVVTAGLVRKSFRVEASGFHGAEPDENRWAFNGGAIDSWSTRLSWTPGDRWVAQASVGRLNHPEAADPGDIIRSTASLSYDRPIAAGNWASSLIWGRNHKTFLQRNLNSYLAESAYQFQHKNYITGRFELVDKDELFDDDLMLREQLAETVGSTFRIAAYTLGYTRDMNMVSWLDTGIGANFSFYGVPTAIQPYYGAHPIGAFVFLRVRFKGSDSMMHMHHGG